MKAHTRAALRRTATVTDPETGRTYPIPAGGSTSEPPPAGDDGQDDGADDDGGDDDAGGDDDGQQQDTGDEDEDRAGGPKALAADNKRLREQRRAARARARELEAEVARLKGESESEVERAAREARESALAPAIAAVRRTAVETAARAAGFENPTVAYRLIDADAIDVDDEDLEVDRAQARAAVEELAASEPYLLTPDERRKREGRGSGSPRGGADTQTGTGTSGSGQSDPSGSFLNALRAKAGTR